uniref:Cuticular protein RR-2 motif n=1 Tax=Triatoma infestans TaxID=30076 RepID=A0A161MJM5_TRIIF
MKRDKTTTTDEGICMKSIKFANNTFSAGLAKDNVVRISIQINVTYYFAIIFFSLMLGMFFYYNISDFIKIFKRMGFDYFLKHK